MIKLRVETDYCILYLGNVWYLCIRNLGHLVCFMKRAKNHITNIIHVHMQYGCETWCLTLKEKVKLGILENGVSNVAFGPKVK